LPIDSVRAPCAAKSSCSGSARDDRGGSSFCQTPVRSGRQPVSIDTRDGLHIATCA
jgi:hypothetical protein